MTLNLSNAIILLSKRYRSVLAKIRESMDLEGVGHPKMKMFSYFTSRCKKKNEKKL